MVFEKFQTYKSENYIFSLYFLNSDISPYMSSPRMKLGRVILHIVMEGTVSQNFNLGLSLDFIDFSKEYFKYHRKLPVFSNKMKTKP